MLKIRLLFKKIQTLRVNNLRIRTIKNVKFSGYYFYVNMNTLGDFQICISVPLNVMLTMFIKAYCVHVVVNTKPI